MARWAWTIADTSGAEQAELTVATNRKVTWRLNEGATAAFVMDGRHETADTISELATDLIIHRDGTKIYRGRVAATADKLDPDTHLLNVETGDYRHLLHRRHWMTTQLARTDVEQSDIAWDDLITHTQGLTGGDLGITRGIGQTTGATTSRTIEPGANIGQELDALATADDPNASGTHAGFEWNITPNLDFDIHYPTRGQTRLGVILEYGGLIATVDRAVQPGEYANAIRLSGAEGVTPVIVTASDISTRPEGRWDKAIGDTTIASDAEAVTRAARLLVDNGTLDPSYQFTLRQDGWEGPDHFFIGDTVTLVIRSGRLNVATTVRVTEIDVTLGESGEETVTVACGPKLRTLQDTLVTDNQRLLVLELQ